jgi:RNAse (barnase) inhibitor barstar
MRIIELDAGGWATPLDFLDALRHAIGVPEGHGLDVDALVDAMVRGGMNSVEPPCTIRIVGATNVNSKIKTEIETLAQALENTRLWRTNHRLGDVEVAIEIAL